MEYDFLKEQFRDLREGQVKLGDKLDLHRHAFSEDLKELREVVDNKITPICDKLHEHDRQLAKHSQFFNLASVILTAGLAGVGGLMAWFWETLNLPRH